MFNKTQLLNQKRELILACIHIYNEAKSALATNGDTESHHRAHTLSRWKRHIKQFNMPLKHALEQPNPLWVFMQEYPEITVLCQRFQMDIFYTDKLNGLFYLAIGLSSLFAANLILLIIPETFILTVWLPAMMASIIGWAISMGIYCDPDRTVTIDQVFDADELEDCFQGSEFDKLISYLSPFTPVFMNKYPAPAVRKILTDIPDSITTLDFEQTEFNKLPPDYLIQLADALPHITTLEISETVLNNMSFKQLDAFAKIIPNIEKVNDHCNIIPSAKIHYLQSRIEANHREKALMIIHTLSQLEKGRPLKTGVQTDGYYPRDIVNYTAEFFPRSAAIRTGIKSLADMEIKRTTPTNTLGYQAASLSNVCLGKNSQ